MLELVLLDKHAVSKELLCGQVQAHFWKLELLALWWRPYGLAGEHAFLTPAASGSVSTSQWGVSLIYLLLKEKKKSVQNGETESDERSVKSFLFFRSSGERINIQIHWSPQTYKVTGTPQVLYKYYNVSLGLKKYFFIKAKIWMLKLSIY